MCIVYMLVLRYACVYSMLSLHPSILEAKIFGSVIGIGHQPQAIISYQYIGKPPYRFIITCKTVYCNRVAPASLEGYA